MRDGCVSFRESCAIHSPCWRPAPFIAVNRTVADVSAGGADPVGVGKGFVDVFSVTHPETVSADLAMQRLATVAEGSLAHGLLSALVTRDAIHRVVNL